MNRLEDDVVDVGENNADALQEEIQDVRVETARSRLVLLLVLVQREAEMHLNTQNT